MFGNGAIGFLDISFELFILNTSGRDGKGLRSGRGD